jgi:hypothetical protein
MALHRRTFVKSAATVPLIAAAGCTNPFESTEDPPEYARWVPATGIDTDGAFFIYYDWSALEDFQDLEESLPEGQDDISGFQPDNETREGADQLLLTPTLVGAFGALALGFSLITYPFVGDLIGDVSGERQSTNATTRDSPEVGEMTGMLMTGDAVVMEGSFDLDTIEANAENYEVVDERDEFTIYEGSSSGFISMEGNSFAVSEDAIVFSMVEEEGRTVVGTMLDTRAGEAERMADRSDDAEWALKTAGHGHIAVGAWGNLESTTESGDNETGFDTDPEDSFTEVENLGETDGEVYSLAISENELTGRMAAGYPSEDALPDRETVESQLGNTADEQDVSLEETRLSVTGRWKTAKPTTEPSG